MTTHIINKDLLEWCKIPFTHLEDHPDRKMPFRICRDSAEMGQIMARELADLIGKNNVQGKSTHAIIPLKYTTTI